MELSGANGQATLFRDVGNITMHMTSMEEVDIAASAAPTTSRSMI